MDVATHFATDEYGFWCEELHDDELARQVTDADNQTAAVLLINTGHLMRAMILWRLRTNTDLHTAMDAVLAISDAIKRGEKLPLI